MRRSYTEKQVLNKLGISDFRHLSKDKVIKFASMVPNMQPEVAKKALEQFPNFASTSLDLMRDYKEIFEEAIADEREGAQVTYEMYRRIMDSDQKILENELSFEQEMLILDHMKAVADAVASFNRERSQDRLKLLAIAGSVATAAIAILGAALGSNISLAQDNDNEDDVIDVDDFEEIE